MSVVRRGACAELCRGCEQYLPVSVKDGGRKHDLVTASSSNDGGHTNKARDDCRMTAKVLSGLPREPSTLLSAWRLLEACDQDPWTQVEVVSVNQKTKKETISERDSVCFLFM